MSTSSTSASSASSQVRIAVGQLRTTSNKLSNMVDVAKCAGWAKREKCSMLFLPECFGFLGESSEQTLVQAEPPLVEALEKHNAPSVTRKLQETIKRASCSVDGEEYATTEVNDSSRPSFAGVEPIYLLDGIREIAKESNLWLSGTIHVSGAPPPTPVANDGGDKGKPPMLSRIYNCHVIVDNEGQLRASYNKIHLFDVSIPGKVNLQESKTTAPGTELVVCDGTPIGKIGLTTCYDVRFPEVYVELIKRGAEVILVPSAFTVPTGAAHWHTLLRGELF